MKPLVLAVCLGLAVLDAIPVHADWPEAMPGSVWGTATKDFNDIEGWGTIGNLTQGVKWATLPADIAFTTYASYRWRLRSRNKLYYDAHGPALGVEFSRDAFSFGGDYEWQKYPGLDYTTNNFALYLSWYKRIDFLKGEDGHASLFGLPVLGFPTTTWGKVYHDFDHLEGTGTLGWVSQAVEWFSLPGDVVFRTLAIYRWRFRSKNEQYFDAHGPGLGIELGHKTVDLGLEYSWQRYPKLNTSTNDWHLYLTWYFGWDLKQ
jgi:hypothetical protein